MRGCFNQLRPGWTTGSAGLPAFLRLLREALVHPGVLRRPPYSRLEQSELRRVVRHRVPAQYSDHNRARSRRRALEV